EEAYQLPQVLPCQVRGEEPRRLVASGEINKPAHTGADFGPDLLELLDLPDGGIERPQPCQGIAPHLGRTGAAELQHRVEQRTTLKTERPRTCTQCPQEHEATKPLM